MPIATPRHHQIPVTVLPLAVAFFLFLTAIAVHADAAPRYLWSGADEGASGNIVERFAPPPGFTRSSTPSGSFAEWLRHLPLRPPQTPVRLYDGRLKFSQDRHIAVINIDTGKRDLQQCADAVMRLRAEYLLSSGAARQIAFNYTNGKRVRYRGGASDRKAFRRYMTGIFAYAGTYSLEREMKPVPLAQMQIGDVFIKGGFPGHAVVVVDMAENPATGEKRFLLVQSYMPAQDMHVLVNPQMAGSPWYSMPPEDGELITPEWIFKPGSLRRFTQ